MGSWAAGVAPGHTVHTHFEKRGRALRQWRACVHARCAAQKRHARCDHHSCHGSLRDVLHSRAEQGGVHAERCCMIARGRWRTVRALGGQVASCRRPGRGASSARPISVVALHNSSPRCGVSAGAARAGMLLGRATQGYARELGLVSRACLSATERLAMSGPTRWRREPPRQPRPHTQGRAFFNRPEVGIAARGQQ